jgi:phosphonate transport system substrate-binding protein
LFAGFAIAVAATGPGHAADAPPLRFGILPLGGPLESRQEWEPLLADMARLIGLPVQAVSVTTYEALALAIRRSEIDIAFVSSKMAMDAVCQRTMKVIAQELRQPQQPAYRAVLISRKKTPPADLETMLRSPGHWRLARGEPLSMSGYLVPQLQLFLPRHVASDTFFRSESIGTHQNNALAVANGEADVGTTSTADLARFKARFPLEYERLNVLWQSDPIPPALIVVRRDMPAALQEQVRNMLTSYGRQAAQRGESERAVLAWLHDFSGFGAANDSTLLPTVRISYQLARLSAASGHWVSESAKRTRLQRIDIDYARTVALLEPRETPLTVLVGSHPD